MEYTWQGDFRIADQTWNQFNIGMRRAMEEDRGIHVFERLEGPSVRYFYHGQWKILGFRQVAMEPRGKKAFRFMVGEQSQQVESPLAAEPMVSTNNSAPDIMESPARYLAFTHRIIRDTRLNERLKKSYSLKCHICGDVRRTGEGGPYAEAHHIRPLGRPHDGLDVKANIVVACPNHHSDFDWGTIALEPADSRTVVHKYDRDLHGKKARFLSSHRIGREYLEYHWTAISKPETPKQSH